MFINDYNTFIFADFVQLLSNFAHRHEIWDPIKVNLGAMAMKGDSIIARSLELRPYHQMLFSIIARISLFFGGGKFCLCAGGYYQLILSPADRAWTTLCQKRSKNNSLKFFTFENNSEVALVTNGLVCDILVSEFDPQLCYYVHFRSNILGKRHESPYLFVMGLIVPVMLF